MTTKEEILKKHILLGQKETRVSKDNDFGSEDYKLTEKYIGNAMQEYADLKTLNWISVNDKLPLKDKNNDIECLCFDKYHNQVRVLVFNVYHNCWDDESGDDYYTDAIGGKVTHWMPLPDKPILTNEG